MFDKLFTPITIKDMTLRNRIIMPAMGTRFTEDRFVNEKHIAYHVARARGGSALNIVEVSSVHALSAPKMFLSIAEDKYVPKLKELTDAIHAEGGKAGIQLWQGGLAVGMDQTAMILLSSDTELAPGFTVPGISKEMIAKLSLEQKCALLSGKNTWQTQEYPKQGVPAAWLSDGPNGLRKQAGAADHLGLNPSVPATCFPTAATMANSWDPALGEEVGRALGEETAANRVNVLLGPGLNLKRSPLCGRSFEYFSEDPYLSGKMAAAYVRGIQANGVAACPKHYAANSQELRRMASNSVLDELLELVLSTTAAIEKAPRKFDEAAHHQLARRAAAQSIVLLKNEGDLLPLKSGKKVALIGDFAITPRYQGAGSSMVNPTCVDSLKDAMEKAGLNMVGYCAGYERSGKANSAYLDEAVSQAKMAEAVILCIGLDESSESEGLDRTHIGIPAVQKELLDAVTSANPNVVAVVSAGSVIETDWVAKCKAVVHGYLGGQAGAAAMLDMLTGWQNPCGKLTETISLQYEDTPRCRLLPRQRAERRVPGRPVCGLPLL